MTMGDLANKMLVQHVSLGVGKVVALEPTAVHVFFPQSNTRFAAKLRLPAAHALLRTDNLEPNSWLEGLSAFSLDPATSRYGLAATWLTHDQAFAQFTAACPGGFADAAQVKTRDSERASLWRAAHEAWVKAFGDGQGARLLADDDVPELVRRALAVEQHVSPLHPSSEKDALEEALSDSDAARAYFSALFEVLGGSAPGRARFESLFGAATRLPIAPVSMWPVATFFPFVAQPDRHVFLRSKPTRDAADRLGCDLRFDETPNWATYAALRALSTRLLQDLAPKGARDFIDIEWFLHSISVKRPPVVKHGKETGSEQRAVVPSTPRGAVRQGRRAGRSRSTP